MKGAPEKLGKTRWWRNIEHLMDAGLQRITGEISPEFPFIVRTWIPGPDGPMSGWYDSYYTGAGTEVAPGSLAMLVVFDVMALLEQAGGRYKVTEAGPAEVVITKQAANP